MKKLFLYLELTCGFLFIIIELFKKTRGVQKTKRLLQYYTKKGALLIMKFKHY